MRNSRFIIRPVKVSKYSKNDYIFWNERPNGLAKLIASQNTCARSYYSTFAIIRRANRKGGASRSNGVKAQYDANLCRRKDVPLFLFFFFLTEVSTILVISFERGTAKDVIGYLLDESLSSSNSVKSNWGYR